MPGVPCDWLSETAIVLNGSGTPPAAATAAAARAALSSSWLRLHGIVPVQVEAMPTIGPSSRSGSTPIARKCSMRAGALGASRRPARACLRRSPSSTARP